MPKVTGFVRDDQGKGLKGVQVSIQAKRDGRPIDESKETKADGSYDFEKIDAGRCSIEPSDVVEFDDGSAWELSTKSPLTHTVGKSGTSRVKVMVFHQIRFGKLERRVAGDIDTMATYPTLTQEVAYAPSPAPTWPGGDGGTGPTPLARVAEDTLRSVLGWRPREQDSRGFVGALTQAFSLAQIEGHVEWTWTPRTYAVQTDLAGGISGAQASLYTRANEALRLSTPLLDGLYPLRLDADPEDTKALTAVVSTHWSELIGELGLAGGPRVSRVDQLFELLLGPTPIVTDPNLVDEESEIGRLRDEFGFGNSGSLVNTLEEEQNLTNYRILTDYTIGLRQTWETNRPFFTRRSADVFFGTQLVLLSRQLLVVGESVDEVRFAMNSVFIGPSERQTIEIEFEDGSVMFVEELLAWVQSFATDEGPRLIQDGGKFAVQHSFLPVAQRLHGLVLEARALANPPGRKLPPGYETGRVQNAWRSLARQLHTLAQQAGKIEHDIPSQP